MCCDGRCGPGQEAREGMRAVAGQFHPVGDLAEGGLDPVASFGDGFQQARWYRGVLLLARWDEDGGAAGGLRGGERLAFEALVRGPGTWRRRPLPGPARGWPPSTAGTRSPASSLPPTGWATS